MQWVAIALFVLVVVAAIAWVVRDHRRDEEEWREWRRRAEEE